jgi:hypothetical protein
MTGRRSNVDLKTSRYFDIADDPDLSYDDKLAGYLRLADEYFETEHYWDWCARHLPHLEDQVYEWVTSAEFNRLLRDTVAVTYPPQEQERFVGHFAGLIDLWISDNAR